MKLQKLLLADTSPEFCAALGQMLAGEYELRVCRDGLEALELLGEFRPDVLVTDLALPGLDGLSLLRTAAALTHRPALLATTRISTPFIQEVIGQIGVDYMMLKPCDIRSLAERVRDLSQCDGGHVCAPVQRNALSSLLLSLNVPAGRRGYTYLEIVIELYRQDPNRSLTKDLYPTAGRVNQSNGPAVERTIRSVIEDAWKDRDEAVWRLYFPVSRSGMVAKPTNRAFIAAVAAALGIQEQWQA